MIASSVLGLVGLVASVCELLVFGVWCWRPSVLEDGGDIESLWGRVTAGLGCPGDWGNVTSVLNLGRGVRKGADFRP